MPRLILLVVIVLALYFAFRWLKTGYQEKGRPFLVKALLTLVAIGFVALAATGRVHWVGAMLASALAALRFALPMLLRALPFLQQVHKARAEKNQSSETPPSQSGEMNIAEALEVLGLSGQPSKKEIIEAHRKLIQKLHPDRGGNDYLAAKINRAKDVLLASFHSI